MKKQKEKRILFTSNIASNSQKTRNSLNSSNQSGSMGSSSKNRGRLSEVVRRRNVGSPSERKGSFSLSFWILSFVLAVSIYFYFSPFQMGTEQVHRWFLMILAVFSPSSYLDLLNTLPDWQGSFTVSRPAILCWKWICLPAALGLGFLFLNILSVRITERAERIFWAFFYGLALWSAFLFYLSFCGLAHAPIFIKCVTVLLALYGGFILVREYRAIPQKEKIKEKMTGRKRLLWSVLFFFLFLNVLLYSLGAMIPVAEYDMLEYHLQGVREIFEQGRIGFSDNNVYRNMPFGAEMFLLWGRNLVNNEMTGILLGKQILAATALVTALGLYSFCRKFFRSGTSGVLAAVIFLSFAWNFQVFSIGLNDGVLGLAIFASLYALLNYFAKDSQRRRRSDLALVALPVGFAISCKYTAVVFLLIPIILLMIFYEFRRFNTKRMSEKIFESQEGKSGQSDPIRRDHHADNASSGIRARFCHSAGVLAFFSIFLLIFGGGWYVKNAVYTGNPVYPLAWNLFGDSTGTWNSEKDLRWKKAHSPENYQWKTLADRMKTAVCGDNFSSPFFLALIPIALGVSVLFFRIGKNAPLLFRMQKSIWFFLIGYLFFFILGWGFLTHRLLRFLVPVLPVVALVLGIGTDLLFFERSRAGNREKATRLLFGIMFPILLIGLGYSFLNSSLNQRDYLASAEAVERDPSRFGHWTVRLNEVVQQEQKEVLLLVGDARGFAWKWPLLYNTCWDNSPLVPLLDNTCVRDKENKIIAISDPNLIKVRLDSKKISLILVDFAELRRFRSPGNYGYSDPEINEELFRLLENAKVLIPLPDLAEAPNIRVYRVSRSVQSR